MGNNAVHFCIQNARNRKWMVTRDSHCQQTTNLRFSERVRIIQIEGPFGLCTKFPPANQMQFADMSAIEKEDADQFRAQHGRPLPMDVFW